MPLEPLGNDVWRGLFELDRPGRWSFVIEALVDRAASLQEELGRKVEAGQEDLTGELPEGAVLSASRRSPSTTALMRRRATASESPGR